MKSTCYRLYLIGIIFLLAIPQIGSAQAKQANNWYFGENIGLSFNYGSPPQILLDGQINIEMNKGTACISDHDGNLLLYSDGVTIWNRNHQVLQNGTNLGIASMQGGIFIQDPGNYNRYYFFNFNTVNNLTQFRYSVIDMSLDNGLGGVLPEQKCIALYTNTSTHLNAVYHANGQDIWILAHAPNSTHFYAFLLTDQGINSVPVISAVGADYPEEGFLKFSPDGKWLASANPGQTGSSQLYRFDNQTGLITSDFLLTIPIDAVGVEFSPDSKKLYVNDGEMALMQYDLINPNPDQILTSAFLLYGDPAGFGAMQLGHDGKIYITSAYNGLSVIHNPKEQGMNCNFVPSDISFLSQECRLSFPNFLQSYFTDPFFTTSQHCFGLPTEFSIGNVEGIDSVFWKFNDAGNAPNDTSTLFKPTYTFSAPGTYYPELTVYSGMNVKTVSDTVIIYPNPSPDLGNDTLFCNAASINLLLDAGPGDHYFWNANFTPGQAGIFQVNATGIYFVKVIANGCSGNDTIMISSYPEPVVDDSNMIITNSDCGTPTGSITGITIQGNIPYQVKWRNGSGNIVGTNLDLLAIPGGVYTLEIAYGTECTASYGPYIVTGDPMILTCTVIHDYCNTGSGAIVVDPYIGEPGDYWYSLDGNTFIQNEGYFTGLPAGDYTVFMRNEAGCLVSLSLIIEDLPCPENVVVFPDLINTPTNEGMAVITPAGGGPYTVLVDGISRLVQNDTISDLSQGAHSIVITNLIGMEFTFSVTVEAVVGLEEDSNAVPFTIFHHDNSNTLYLDFGKTTLSGNAYAEIRTINGQLLSTHSIQTPRTEISLTDIPKGFYLITLYSEKGGRSVKFIK